MNRFAFFTLVLLASCQSSQTAPETKPEALKPRVTPGDKCVTNANCGVGFYCYTGAIAMDGGLDGGTPTIRFCVVQQGQGGPCTANDQCLSAVCCNATPRNPVCIGPGCF